MADEMVEKLQQQIQSAKPYHVQAHSVTSRLERAKDVAAKMLAELTSTKDEVDKAKIELDKRVQNAEIALQEAQRQVQALQQEAKETFARGFCNEEGTGPVPKMDESILAGSSDEFK
eukprot:2155377-Pyramimonas_sp.AAC.1